VAAAALALAVAAAVLVAITAVGASRTAEAATEAGQRLLDTTLADGQDAEGCTAREVGDGVLRRLTCPGDPEEAPTVIGYTAHEGGGAAAALDDDIATNDLGRLDDRFDCGQTFDDGGPGPEGWLPVVDGEDVEVGRMACWVDGDGDAVLSWAWDDLGTLGVAEQRGGGAGGLSELRSWWDSTADRGFN
jgi:serine/threonine-protein kinase